MLFRVQDKTGRGPFKPGFTHKWSESNCRLPSIMEDFPGITDKIIPYHHRGWHLGCGVRNGVGKWFSESELIKLSKLGYQVVTVDKYDVVCESENQVVFATKKPLRKLRPLI